MVKQSTLDRQGQVLGLVKRDFPDLFHTKAPVPLKIGIREDLMEHFRGEIGAWKIRRFLPWWTKRRLYREALKTAPYRYALDGSTSELLDEHRVAEKREPVSLMTDPAPTTMQVNAGQ